MSDPQNVVPEPTLSCVCGNIHAPVMSARVDKGFSGRKLFCPRCLFSAPRSTSLVGAYQNWNVAVRAARLAQAQKGKPQRRT